ncbi:MAG TPA: alpha/beta hydrolase, partial [Vicinamibacteria bacterium]|nr:alpha/beta hydrolase [Vicinamibacteria bacterium]
DLRRALAESVCGDMAGRLIGGTPEAFPRRYAEASPIELVPLGVRQHLLHGALDPIVPVAFARDFAAASARAGDAVALTVVEDTGHFEPIAPTSKAWPAVRDAILDLAG